MNLCAFVNTVQGQMFIPVVSFGTIKSLLYFSGLFAALAVLAGYFAWNPPAPKSVFGKTEISRRE